MSGAALVRSAWTVSNELRPLGPDDAALAALPLSHMFGQSALLNACVAVGARIVLMHRFEAERAAQLVQSEKLTYLALVPTMLHDLLAAIERHRVDVTSVKYCAVGGAPISAALLDTASAVLGPAVLTGYGLTEAAGVAMTHRVGESVSPGSIGRLIPGLDCQIVDEHGRPVEAGETGELRLRGATLADGYFRAPEETARAFRDGWLRTGDLVARRPDGSFTLVGRRKELIIRGGFKVVPHEVEDVLLGFEGVEQACVVGLPEPRLGEVVGAAVVARDGATLDVEALRGFCRKRLAGFKCPVYVAVLGSLPRNHTGKVHRMAVRDQLIEARRSAGTVAS
jgi:long-chain acyl-CoA synthetase